MMMTRRDAIKTLGVGVAGLSAGMFFPANVFASETKSAAFTLDPLPYAFDALEPAIDAATMEIHYGKHHAGYVNNLNKAIEAEPSLAGKPIEKLLANLDAIPESMRTSVRNNGGGHYNHTLFWQSLNAKGGEPQGAFRNAIEKKFTNLDGLKDTLKKGGASVFGSGWVWLSLDKDRELVVETTPNQDNPLSRGHAPLLGLDVWEHAYYLRYQNRRAEYLDAIVEIVNWPVVALRYQYGLA